MLKCLATKPPTVVMGPGVRRDDTEGVARDEFNFQTAKENDAPSHPLSTSSLRTPGPIRRAVAVERRCCDISLPNHRRWFGSEISQHRLSTATARRMGPGVRRDDVERGCEGASFSLAV